jgi:hypothetical protein
MIFFIAKCATSNGSDPVGSWDAIYCNYRTSAVARKQQQQPRQQQLVKYFSKCRDVLYGWTLTTARMLAKAKKPAKGRITAAARTPAAARTVAVEETPAEARTTAGTGTSATFGIPSASASGMMPPPASDAQHRPGH